MKVQFITSSNTYLISIFMYKSVELTMNFVVFIHFFIQIRGYKKDMQNRSHHDDAPLNLSQCQNWTFSDSK